MEESPHTLQVLLQQDVGGHHLQVHQGVQLHWGMVFAQTYLKEVKRFEEMIFASVTFSCGDVFM